MATLTAPPPEAKKPEKKVLTTDERTMKEKMTRIGYFVGALLLHLIIFIMVATLIIFPAFHPPVDDFNKTFVPPSSPPPPPPAQQTPKVPTHTVTPPVAMISTPSPTPTFNIPLPDFSKATTPDAVTQKITSAVTVQAVKMSDARLTKIQATEMGWGRDPNNIRDSNSDPRAVVAKFPVFLAQYADGDWGCNIKLYENKIDAGSLPNLVAKINEWSHNKIQGAVVPQPLNIGGPDLLAKKPPFVFFTGHKNFVLTETEIQNLREYLQAGGAIWGDNALAGRGSRFDVAFRREMKRVVPDADKNFEPVPMTHDMFDKMGYYTIQKLPSGMNYYAEPIEHLDIDGKLAILYTPNDYSDMMWMRILPGDNDQFVTRYPDPHQLYTDANMDRFSDMYYRNFKLESCLAVQKLGMNIVAYLLVRFDKELQNQ